MISVLCFSKDRPLQIEAYVRSFLWSFSGDAKLSVLYTCEEKYRAGYDTLITEYPQVLPFQFNIELRFQDLYSMRLIC
jgi:hypothetical protein